MMMICLHHGDDDQVNDFNKKKQRPFLVKQYDREWKRLNGPIIIYDGHRLLEGKLYGNSIFKYGKMIIIHS